MKISGIYKIINLITKLFYIGSSSNVSARFRQHEYDLNKNSHDNSLLQNAWNKYGAENFEFQVLEFVLIENLLKAEQHWLDQTRCYEREFGYNLNKLANSVIGIKWSEESKRRFSEKKKGIIPSFETKAKMSISQKARAHIQSAKMKGRKPSLQEIANKVAAVRKFDKWPCVDGWKCKCEICKETKRSDQRSYRDRLRLEGRYSYGPQLKAID